MDGNRALHGSYIQSFLNMFKLCSVGLSCFCLKTWKHIP
jgi:hypothetical protein